MRPSSTRKAAHEARQRIQAALDQDDEFPAVWSKYGQVEIKASQVLPGQDTGFGVWATTTFEPGDIITGCDGRFLTLEEWKSSSKQDQTHDAVLPPESQLLRGFRRPDLVCANGLWVNAGSLVNDARDSVRNNADRQAFPISAIQGLAVDWNTCRPVRLARKMKTRLFIIATQTIKPGQEIFTSYGKYYWDRHES